MTIAILRRRATRVAAYVVACAMFLVARTVDAATDTARPGDALRALDARIIDATRTLQASRSALRPLDERILARIDAARRDFDVLSREEAAHPLDADATLSGKRRAIARLLENLERARDTPADATLPKLVPEISEGTAPAILSPRASMGHDCAHALTVAAGSAIETVLSGANTPRSALWLRVAPRNAAPRCSFLRMRPRPT